MKNKGFTLMEMIAVIAIIGIILLVAIPITSEMIKNNKLDKYKAYVKAVETAAYTYADLEMKDVPTIGYKDIILQNLIDAKYLKEFSDGNKISWSYETQYIRLYKDANGKITIADSAVTEIKDFSLNFENSKYTCTKDSCD